MSGKEGCSMNIREAVSDDNKELQKLMAKCPQGTKFIVSVVNTPDFFARAKAYESYKVYVAYEGDQIIGSMAYAMRDAIVNGNNCSVGYIFQGFTSPHHRRKGVASQLYHHIENQLIQHGAVLSYGLIMEDNQSSIRLIEGEGFKLHRTLDLSILLVYKEMDISSTIKIRPISSEDLAEVAKLLNETWQGFDLYETTSADALASFISRTPAYSFDNLFVLEDQGEIVACLGFWNWSQITSLTVKALSLKLRMIGLLLDIIRYFRPMPRSINSGSVLKQMVLTPIGFKNPRYLSMLLKYLNNLAFQRGIEQIFCFCKRNHVLLCSMKGFIRIDEKVYLYIKPLHENILLSDQPVFINGIDL
ncbi:MAG: GNAT family N-acetyltransferase [Methanosarcinaceae archaeon]|nr:GNAT family N-acetyltransferase [Methanosarcinaceae archaeon]